jgi:hypothetical protein
LRRPVAIRQSRSEQRTCPPAVPRQKPRTSRRRSFLALTAIAPRLNPVLYDVAIPILRRVNPRILRSVMPRPPYSVGAQTMDHAILHLPPDVLSVPLQRNARRRLSIWPIAQAERQQQIDTWTGIADRVVLVRVERPVLVNRPAFQVGILATAASTKHCSSEHRSLLIERGAPRYVNGNGDT